MAEMCHVVTTEHTWLANPKFVDLVLKKQ